MARNRMRIEFELVTAPGQSVSESASQPVCQINYIKIEDRFSGIRGPEGDSRKTLCAKETRLLLRVCAQERVCS